MKLYTALLAPIFFLCIDGIAMEKSNIEIYKADAADVHKIVQLINNYAVKDKDKIVVLPETFRLPAVENAVAVQRLYVAKDLENIVAFKKAFIVKDQNEFDNITQEELRCAGENSTLISAECHIESRVTKMITIPRFDLNNSAVIYCGADFTHPTYRNQRINSRLMQYALNAIQASIIEDIKTHKKNQIALLYGLTKTNAGDQGGIDRTPSLMKAFSTFAQQIAYASGHYGTNFLYHGKYNSFMPTFDSTSLTCTPLPDNQAIAGYGNVLLYSFSRK